jgi:hypothetical protein
VKKLSRTRVRDLLIILGITAVLSFAVLRVVGASSTVPTVPWLAPVTLLVIGIALIVTARVLRPRLQHRKGTQPVDALLAGRLVALSFAASRAGAAITGLYAGWLVAALMVTDGLDSPYGRGRAVTSAAAALAGSLVVVGGLLLERALTIDLKDGEGDEPDDAAGAPAA